MGKLHLILLCVFVLVVILLTFDFSFLNNSFHLIPAADVDRNCGNKGSKSIPRTGLVYLIHLPKTGGTYLRTRFDRMAEKDNTFNQINYDRNGKSLEDIISTLNELEEANYYNQLHIFQHHHKYPAVVDIVPFLLEYKERSEKKGFVFDIILASLRDPLDLAISQYNYAQQNYYVANTFMDFIGKKQNPLRNSILYKTPVRNVNENFPSDKTVDEILMPVFKVLFDIDYIFFLKTLDDEMELYFECKLNRKFLSRTRPANVSKKVIYKEDLDLEELRTFYQIHALDQYLYTKSYTLFFHKDFCSID